MKLVFLHLRFIILSSLYLATPLSIFGSSILDNSKFWPEKVTVNVEITGVKHGNIVKPGSEWMFLRYENGKCLVDMGHNGIHALNVKDTDVLERVKKISEENIFPREGLFTYRYTKSFHDPKTLRGLQSGDLDKYDYFALFYFDYESGSKVTEVLSNFVKNYTNKAESKLNLKVLFIVSNNLLKEKQLSDYITDGLFAPTSTPFLYESTVYTLAHDHEKKGDVVLVDKFGKVIKQFFLSKVDDDKLFKTLKDALEKEAADPTSKE